MAFDAVDFKVKLPTYVPKGYEMQGANIYNTDDDISLVISYHENNSNTFELRQSVIEASLESTLTESAGFSWEEIKIGQYQAYKQISETTTEKSIVMKKEDNLFITVYSADLEFAELIQVLESI